MNSQTEGVTFVGRLGTYRYLDMGDGASGNLVEWYDVYVYTVFASYFEAQFFVRAASIIEKFFAFRGREREDLAGALAQQAHVFHDGIQMPIITAICLLMFVGAAPGSTGGGIKVTTLAVLAAAFPALLHRLMTQCDAVFLNSNEHPRATVTVETRDALRLAADLFGGMLTRRELDARVTALVEAAIRWR